MPADREGIVILGAGPVGLDAALAAADRGLPFTLYEEGPEVGANIRQWHHVRMFSPWSMNASPRMREALHRRGHEVPDGSETPTGQELVEELLEPLAGLPEIRSHLRTGCRAVAVSREGALKNQEIGAPERGERPFRILLRDAFGSEWVERAGAVLDCTGSWGNPMPLGDGGIPAPGESSFQDRILRVVPEPEKEPDRWRDRTVLLVGGGHSAQTAARDLARFAESEPGTRAIWALRSAEPAWPAAEDDPLPRRRELEADAHQLAGGACRHVDVRAGQVVDGLEPDGGQIRVRLRRDSGEVSSEVVDRIVGLTGGAGDPSLHRELQVHQCYATEGPMKLAAALLASGAGSDGADCLDQEGHGAETLRNPEPRFFILGEKSYGRTNTFLLRVGWEQVDDVFQALL